MYDHEKSDPAIVAVKPTNKAGQPAAELVEPRAGAEGNVSQQSTGRAQYRGTVSQALARIRQAARQRKKEKFTALFHHVSIDHLAEAFSELKENAAAGVDGLTCRDYEQHLERNLEDLHARVHRGAYRALPSRRVYIPKPDGRQRPIAVAALEDKIVQRATAAVLSAIYEEDFLGFSYGFRPGRSTHDAMDALMVGITSTKVNWILDADIRSFFDTVSQEWLIKFVEHRVGDRRIIRLIQKWLKAGVLEDGIVTVSDKGTGQGSVISPLLANLYLHYAFDLWAERWRRREAAGNMIIVRYADDLIVGFEHETDALASSTRCVSGYRSLHCRFIRRRPADRVWTLRGGKPQAARARQTGDLRLPGLHLYLRQNSSGQIPNQTEVPAGSHAGKVASHQTGTATEHSSADSPAGKMVAAGRHRLLQLPRGADKQFDTDRVPIPRHQSLAAHATAAEPERLDDLGADQAVGRRLAPETANPSSVARESLRR
jgi:group II intron reverse transcriptase/maturase